MKKYLLISLAAISLVACAEKLDDTSSPVEKGELETSYIAVTLKSDDMGTRADSDDYDRGIPEERAVKNAHFFFFKDGQPFVVTDNGSVTSPGGEKNYLKLDLSGETPDMPNISDIKDKVLVFRNYKGEYPNQIVAVLNWDPKAYIYTLSDLRRVITSVGNDEKGYVMSNSVYVDAAGQMVDAVAITESNIGTSADEAKDHPVTLHVERVGAKVVLTTGRSDNLYPVGKSIQGKEVYAKILNWELYNDHETSYLLKNIDGYKDWTGDEFGFSQWNDSNWFRSYWANSLYLTTPFPNNSFSWNDDVKNQTPGPESRIYCGENTKQVDDRNYTDPIDIRTKVIVKARLVESDGVTPVEVSNWYGQDFLGEESLLEQVANSLKISYYYSEDGGVTFIGLKPEDIKCVARNPEDENAYEVYFQLNDDPVYDATAKTWYKYVDGQYVKFDDISLLNNELASVQPALVYKSGMTYYYTDIKHLGKPDTTTGYGVVRNHVYKVNITSVSGYGTPYYDGDIKYIEPAKPKDIVTFVAAQIYILSWRVVSDGYDV